MQKKWEIKKEIQAAKHNIQILEQRRARSQAALVEALLTHTEPTDEDVDFFNMYTNQINEERERLHGLMAEYDSLDD